MLRTFLTFSSQVILKLIIGNDDFFARVVRASFIIQLKLSLKLSIEMYMNAIVRKLLCIINKSINSIEPALKKLLNGTYLAL